MGIIDKADVYFTELNICRSLSDGEGGSLKLDLSSLNTPETSAEQPISALKGESLYHNTVKLIDSGGIDLDHGLMLLKKAAEDGFALAWLHLGGLYSNEKSAFYNPTLAFECFKGAADLESGEGYYKLGLCYNSGVGCEKNADLAVDCFLNGANLGDADCICALGICREFGIGCQIDYEMAVNLYHLAAEKDCATAINNLGGCYFHGHGVEQDKERAISEAVRVTKPGGYILVAYCMNEYSILTYGFKENHMKEIMEQGKVNEEFRVMPSTGDLYDYVRLEDIAEVNAAADVERIQIISADGPANHMRQILNAMDEETYELFIQYHLSTCERPELLGASAHTLDILRKVIK